MGEDGTQDEFVFPLDNPDEDGDYVYAEGESGRRRKRVQVFDRNNGPVEDDQGLKARQMDEGWLPETLKGLSSSDEDDNEIHKLARRVRRERERAEALARAEARRAAAEARQAEMESKKAAKRRPKPFPLHGGAEHVSTRFPEHVPAPVSLVMQYFIVYLKSGCCQTGTVAFPIPVLPSAFRARDGFKLPIPRKITFQTPRAVSGVFSFPNF